MVAVREFEAKDAGLVESLAHRASVDGIERLLDERRELADLGPHPRKVRNCALVEQALEVGDGRDLFDVELVRDDLDDLRWHRIARREDEGAPEGQADAQMRLVARGATERRDLARRRHRPFEGSVEGVLVDRGPVGEVHRLTRSGEIAEHRVTHEGTERRQQQRNCAQALVQRRVRR